MFPKETGLSDDSIVCEYECQGTDGLQVSHYLPLRYTYLDMCDIGIHERSDLGMQYALTSSSTAKTSPTSRSLRLLVGMKKFTGLIPWRNIDLYLQDAYIEMLHMRTFLNSKCSSVLQIDPEISFVP